ncbi:MAG: hypothetical protein ABS36_03385 [Acidobacteria bacterium SCN 69-37]|nr:MAG: hypothetical protein ABS36_03385 [Acidobacteria bacterium SCN 69-37]
MAHLRRCAVVDADALFEAARESTPLMYPWMPWCHPGYVIDESRIWLAEQVAAFDAREAFSFAVVGHDGRYLGGCGLNRIDTVNRRANLGYWIRSTATGRGAATQAVQLARDWAFAHTDLIRLEIVVATGNLPSLRVAEKSGALREGVLRRRILLHGVAHDAAIFSFTREP